MRLKASPTVFASSSITQLPLPLVVSVYLLGPKFLLVAQRRPTNERVVAYRSRCDPSFCPCEGGRQETRELRRIDGDHKKGKDTNDPVSSFQTCAFFPFRQPKIIAGKTKRSALNLQSKCVSEGGRSKRWWRKEAI